MLEDRVQEDLVIQATDPEESSRRKLLWLNAKVRIRS